VRTPRTRGTCSVAAIELADAEGLAALSMRRVADRLGVGTMSLSTYVPGKAELLDLMLDVVLAEEARPGADAGWRAGLELRAREDWALYHRHPWILQISPGRALLGPNETALFESTLRGRGERPQRQRDGAGGQPGRRVHQGRGPERGRRRPGRAAHGHLRRAVVEGQGAAVRQVLRPGPLPDRHPGGRVGAFEQPATDEEYTVAVARESFEFGLPRVLDGIEAFVAARAAEPPAGSEGG
jgi:AcrR family transcriptional regulator